MIKPEGQGCFLGRLFAKWTVDRDVKALIKSQGGIIPTKALSQDYVDPAPGTATASYPSNPADTCPFNPYADR